MVRTMGCVLVAPLLTEALKRERSMDQCQATLAYLSRVGSNKKKKKRKDNGVNNLTCPL